MNTTFFYAGRVGWKRGLARRVSKISMFRIHFDEMYGEERSVVSFWYLFIVDRTPDRCSIVVRSGNLKRFIISFAKNVYINRWVVASSVVRYSPALDGALCTYAAPIFQRWRHMRDRKTEARCDALHLQPRFVHVQESVGMHSVNWQYYSYYQFWQWESNAPIVLVVVLQVLLTCG